MNLTNISWTDYTSNPIRARNKETGKVGHYVESELAEWRKPKYEGKKVFVCDMTDMFGEWVPDEWLDRIWAAMALAPGVIFQILTKRPERMYRYLSAPERREEVAASAFEMCLNDTEAGKDFLGGLKDWGTFAGDGWDDIEFLTIARRVAFREDLQA